MKTISVATAVVCVTAVAAQSEWKTIALPGGMCADGSPYSFSFREGTADGLVVEFEGGGGCWDAKTCAKRAYLPKKMANLTYNTQVPDDLSDILNRRVDQEMLKETIDPPNVDAYAVSEGNIPEVKDWSQIFIPYCTGDAHMGDNTMTFDKGQVVNFKGRVNTELVLDWMQKRFKTEPPSQVLVSGVSAGALGAMVWAATIFNDFPNSQHIFFGDSYVGVMAKTQWQDAKKNWLALPSFPTFIPGVADIIDGDWSLEMVGDFYKLVVQHFANGRFGQFTSNRDKVQTLFYELGGGGKGSAKGLGALRGFAQNVLTGGGYDWTAVMRKQIMKQNAPNNAAYYIAPGTQHVRDGNHPKGSYANVLSGGIYRAELQTWVRQLVDTQKPLPDNVDCAEGGSGECWKV